MINANQISFHPWKSADDPEEDAAVQDDVPISGGGRSASIMFCGYTLGENRALADGSLRFPLLGAEVTRVNFKLLSGGSDWPFPITKVWQANFSLFTPSSDHLTSHPTVGLHQCRLILLCN